MNWIFSPPRYERVLALRIFWLLVWVRLGLWFVEMKRVRGWLLERQSPPHVENLRPKRVAFLVSRLARPIPDATCLTQALVLEHLLKHATATVELRIGVRRSDGENPVEAHAWIVNANQQVLIGNRANLAEYAILSTSQIDADIVSTHNSP